MTSNGLDIHYSSRNCDASLAKEGTYSYPKIPANEHRGFVVAENETYSTAKEEMDFPRAH